MHYIFSHVCTACVILNSYMINITVMFKVFIYQTKS